MTNTIEIYAPRWHDRTVLVAKHKVFAGVPRHIIKFTKAPTLKDKYMIDTAKLVKYPVITNGVIDCYAVPLADFEVMA